jgi:hypothetical protein
MVWIFVKACRACPSKVSSISLPVSGLSPAMPETYINPPAITACGINVFKRGILSVLKLIFDDMAIGF